MRTNVHPLDIRATRMLAADVRSLSERAKRIGIPSAAATLELVSEALDRLYDEYLIELNNAAARTNT